VPVIYGGSWSYDVQLSYDESYDGALEQRDAWLLFGVGMLRDALVRFFYV
jgi:hypothetical protein